MDFNVFTLPDLTPRTNTTFIDEMNRRNQEMLGNIDPLGEIPAEEVKPIFGGNQEARKQKNRIQRLSVFVLGIAPASLAVPILIAVL